MCKFCIHEEHRLYMQCNQGLKEPITHNETGNLLSDYLFLCCNISFVLAQHNLDRHPVLGRHGNALLHFQWSCQQLLGQIKGIPLIQPYKRYDSLFHCNTQGEHDCTSAASRPRGIQALLWQGCVSRAMTFCLRFQQKYWSLICGDQRWMCQQSTLNTLERL